MLGQGDHKYSVLDDNTELHEVMQEFNSCGQMEGDTSTDKEYDPALGKVCEVDQGEGQIFMYREDSTNVSHLGT